MTTAEFVDYLAQNAATRDLADQLERIVDERRSERRSAFALTGPRAA